MIEAEVQQEIGRAKNAVQEYLIRKLLLPKIYLDAEWNGSAVSLLAVDRGGSGDIHVANITSTRPHFVEPPLGHELTMVSDDPLDQPLGALRNVPGHYRYLVVLVPGSRQKEYYAASKLQKATIAEDGVGRVGILFADLSTDTPVVKPIVKPERFRSSKEIMELADQYVAQHTANWEVRE